MRQNGGESRQKRRCKYNLFFLLGICHLVVHRKIIRKVNDNDDGRVVMQARTVTEGLSVCVSTVSFGLHRRGFVYSGNWEGRMSVVLSGAICSTGAASSALTGEIDSAYSVSACAFAVARYVSPALGCAVLIEHAIAGRPSMAMKLRRELSPPVFVVVVNYRRPLIASRVGCASARKLFFPAKGGGGARKGGAGLR